MAKHGGLNRLREKASFGITLVTVAGVAVFLGWLMGQYAISWVTSPTGRPDITDTDLQGLQRSLEQTDLSAIADDEGPIVSDRNDAPETATSVPPATPASPGAGDDQLWRVQVGAFSDESRARALLAQLQEAGYEAALVTGQLFRVQVGAFREESRARNLVQALAEDGFEAFVTR